MNHRAMKCLIVEDNPMARLALRNLIADLTFLELVGECENAQEAFNTLAQTSVDLLFLDVEMPGRTGLQLLESLEVKPLCILITSKRDYAVEAFAHRVVDYLVKPLDFTRFAQAVQRARELYEQQNPEPAPVAGHLFVRGTSGWDRLAYADILLVQAMGDYVNIHTAQRRYTVYSTLRQMEERLPADRFLRVHRSYLVAIDHIDHFDDQSVRVHKHVVPVSDTYRGKLLQRLNLL